VLLKPVSLPQNVTSGSDDGKNTHRPIFFYRVLV